MQEQQLPDMSMDASTLYQEETFTDGQVGEIRRLTPVKSDGARDPSRSMRFTGSTQIMSSAGPIPLSFEIDADSLEQAVEKFGTLAREKLEETTRQLEQMRQEQASSIVTPDQLVGGGPGGPAGGGAGGGFQLR